MRVAIPARPPSARRRTCVQRSVAVLKCGFSGDDSGVHRRAILCVRPRTQPVSAPCGLGSSPKRRQHRPAVDRAWRPSKGACRRSGRGDAACPYIRVPRWRGVDCSVFLRRSRQRRQRARLPQCWLSTAARRAILLDPLRRGTLKSSSPLITTSRYCISNPYGRRVRLVTPYVFDYDHLFSYADLTMIIWRAPHRRGGSRCARAARRSHRGRRHAPSLPSSAWRGA